MGNCRAANYKLEPMSWINVKLKAGRIIPALATTTAAVAGLQTLEYIKTMKECKLEEFRNCFLNLAVPIMNSAEPGAPLSVELTEEVKVNLWDRWEIKKGKELRVRELFEHIEKTYKLKPKDLMKGSTPLYFHAVMEVPGKEKQKEETLNSTIAELVGIEVSAVV